MVCNCFLTLGGCSYSNLLYSNEDKCIYSFNKCLLSGYFMPDTHLGIGGTVTNNTGKTPLFKEFIV